MKRTGRDPGGNIMILPPVTMEEQIAVQREIKARTILLQSLPEDHMADFHHLDDAKDIWLAVKARFGGNEESKKMRKSMLKQEFADFKISKSEGLHKGYDRFQKVLSQLNQMQARPDNEDCNMKFLRALPPSWSHVAITFKTKGGLDFLSFDDLYNKLRTLEIDVKGGSSYDSRVPAAPTHLEQQKSWYQNNQLALEEKIRILTADLGNTTNMLKYTEKLNEHAKLDNMNTKVKLEESEARFDKWMESSKNLVKLINSSMSSTSKFGLGFGDTFRSDEVFDLSAPSIFDSCLKDAIKKPLY
ncbi:hypothetical protein Tco_1332963, partial [Tanacetum coccineum]